MKDISILQKEWLKSDQEKIKPKSKDKNKAKRQYLHFDERIKEITEEISSNIFSSDFILKYPFYPFIRYTQIKRRLKKSVSVVNGKKVKKLEIIKKPRPIDYAAHLDTLIYSWYAHLISNQYEKKILDYGIGKNVIAYRSIEGKGTKDFVKEAIDFIKVHPGYVAVALDIEKFFENINHKNLKDVWSKIINLDHLPDDHYKVFKAITEYRYVTMESLHKSLSFGQKDHYGMRKICDSVTFRKKIVAGGLLQKNPKFQKHGNGAGIPQGSAISCVLSNIYLLDFDIFLTEFVSENDGFYMRYSDDILIIVPESKVESVVNQATDFLDKNHHLKINSGKTEKVKFTLKDGRLIAIDLIDNNKPGLLKYLGIVFDGENTYLRHAGLTRYQRKRNMGVKRSLKNALEWKRSLQESYPEHTKSKGRNYLKYAASVAETLDSKKIKIQTSEGRAKKQTKRIVEEFKKKTSKQK